MVTLGTFWIICKILFPLFFWGFVLYNLPFVIGAIFTLALAVLVLPFTITAYIVGRIYEAATKTKSSQNKYEYNSSYQDQRVQPDVQPSKGKELYDILGVKYNASKEEIRTAFKNKMMMNHPDKLAALDPELQRFATERTIAIKNAYERLTASIH